MKKLLLVGFGAFLCMAVSHAEHAWGPYHWARSTSPFDLILINSTTGDWGDYVSLAVSDWSQSAKLNLQEDTNGSTSKKVRRQCKGGTGKVRICNLAYGQNGWLGIAGISIDSNGHITTGYTKLNDTYFSWDYYKTPLWKQSVTCQELGHDLGLGHQDEVFGNESLDSCMDYQDPPYAYPNAHDYEQLETNYSDSDTYDSYYDPGDSGGGGGGDGGNDGCNAPPGKGCNKARPGNNSDIGWGASLGRRGQQETFMRTDPDGTRHITFVTWVIGH
ncbi:MAG: hypothetical protein IIA09_06690 [Proteobacteria bacterium]|nr:hypothetical protein [Pseudomonadota bacterium]